MSVTCGRNGFSSGERPSERAIARSAELSSTAAAGTWLAVAATTRASRQYSSRSKWSVKGVADTAAALACSVFVRHLDHPWLFASRLGIVTGLVTGVGMAFSPHVEYYADNLPQRRMGVVGVALMFCGFALQSLQYWLAIFDVHIT